MLYFFAIETQFTCVDRNSEFQQQGIDERSGGPDPDCNSLLNKCWGVFVDLTQGAWHKAGDCKAHSLFDIDPDNDQYAGNVEGEHVFSGLGTQEEEKSSDVEDHCSPHPGNQGIVTVQSEIEIFHGSEVDGT